MATKKATKLGTRLDHLEVDANTLIEALNDKAKSDALLKAKGWTRKDLLARADLLAKELASSIAAVNVV
jgi:uncharacterized protein YbjT (DUF2867 family)